MNTSIVLALGAMLMGALADLAYKVAQNRGVNSTTFVFVQSMVFSAVIWTIAVSTGQVSKINSASWIYGLPFGLLTFGGVLLFVMSLKEGKASVNTPVFRLSFALTAIGAILVLHEPLNLPKVLGMLFAIFAVLSLADLPAFKNSRSAYLRSMMYLIGAVLLMGIGGVVNKEALNQGSLTIPLIAVSNLAFTPAAFVAALAAGQIRPNKATLRFAPLVGALQIAWAVLLTESLQTGEASVTVPVVNLSFVLTAILAMLFLREAVSGWLVAGLGAAILAVIAFGFA